MPLESERPKAVAGEQELADFFSQHRHFFEAYAGDSSLTIKPAPPELGTFGIDLEKGTLFAEPKFFTDRGYSPDKAMFATLHEFEHFREMKQLLDEPEGEGQWLNHRQKMESKKRLHILDNCFDDIKMNRQVAERAPVLLPTRTSLYRENLFPVSDYTSQPRHLQFAYALLRRPMLEDEEMILSPEVQAEIDQLEAIESSGVKLLEYASRPETPMSMRLELQKRFLEPVYEKLFQEDVAERREQAKDNQGQKESGEAGAGDESEPSAGENDESKNQRTNQPAKQQPAGESANPEDYFRDDYDQYDAVSPEPIDWTDPEIEEKIESYIKAREKKSAEEEAREAYARAEGVTLSEIREYQNYFRQLEDLENPTSGEKVIEELRQIFKQIISERQKERYARKHPLTEGEILIRPAEAVVSILAGENEPEVWESQEKKELPQELYGDFDVTLVCDRSGSMQGDKAAEQRKATILILEALKEFSDELEDWRTDLKYELNVRTEVWGFGGEAEVRVLKPLSEMLSEKQRVEVYKQLAQTSGDSTLDFLALKKIKDEVTSEEWQKIKDKKLRKVIIVLTDGQSADASQVQKILEDLRDKNVAIAAIGITKSGKPAEATYAPDGQVCEEVSQLAVVLADLLKNYLRELLIKK